MTRHFVKTVVFSAMALTAASAFSATWYVATNGDDSRGGASPAEAFLTITRGVAALEAGDTLIVGPGTYREEVFIEKSGTPSNPIVVKAAVPGRTELVGSVRITDWSPVRGRRQVFVAPFTETTHLVYEKDTGVDYVETAGLDMVEDEPGTFFHDQAAQRIYVHPSDDLGMGHHVVDACVLDYGLASRTTDPGNLHEPRRVGLTIEGFVVRDYATYGIFIHNADYCEIRDCIVHHCRGGIFTYSSLRSRIVGCEAFACADRFNREQGNIGMMGYIFECIQESNVVHDTRQYGIRFYGGQYGNIMRDNLAYGCEIGIHVKGQLYDQENANRLGRFSDNGNPAMPPNLTNLFEGNVCHEVSGSAGLIPNFSIYRRNTGEKTSAGRVELDRNNLDLTSEEMLTAGFAAPDWHDLRLQSDSPYRGKGRAGQDPGAYPYRGDVFFVGPDGDDAREGTSVATAWRTLSHAAAKLQAGQTLYLLPGTYDAPLRLEGLAGSAAPTMVRSRTKGDAIIRGGSGDGAPLVELVGCTNVWIQGLRVKGGQEAAVLLRDCEAVRFEQSDVFDGAGTGVRVKDCVDVRLLGNSIVFNGGPAVEIEGAAAVADASTWNPSYRIVNNILRANGGGLRLPATAVSALWCDFNNMDTPLPAGAGTHNVDLAAGFVDPARRDLRLMPTSLCKGRGYLDRPIGPGRLQPVPADAVSFDAPRVLGVSDRSADLSWSINGGKATMLVAYGTDPGNLTNVVVRDTGPWYRRHHATTLLDLLPATRYYLRVGARRLLDGPTPYHSFRYLWPERSPAGEVEYYATLRKEDVLGDRLVSFTTRAGVTVAPRVLHVATNGVDSSSGLEAAPLGSLRRAAAMAQPGDRVIVHAGTYTEMVRPLRSGLPGYPIVFEAAAGERVEIDGGRETIPFGFDLKDRHHIVVRGFVFFGQAEAASESGGFGQVCVLGASDILIERCLFDGRMNYVNPVYVGWSRDVTIHNNIFVSHHGSIMGHDNDGTVTITRNSFLGPTLAKAYIPRSHRLVIRNNFFGEHLFPKKKQQYKLKLPLIDEIDEDYNCYYFDPANDEMRIIDFMPSTESAEETTAQPEDDSRKARIGVRKTLDAWREAYGQGMHSFVITDPEWADPAAVEAARFRARGWPNRFFAYAPLTRAALGFMPGSPCMGQGEGGVNIGADYTY